METITKKFYSVNLVAFIYMITGKLPAIDKDADGLIYFMYEDSPTITLAVNVYKRNRVEIDLHSFLNAFRDIRSLMRTIR